MPKFVAEYYFNDKINLAYGFIRFFFGAGMPHHLQTRMVMASVSVESGLGNGSPASPCSSCLAKEQSLHKHRHQKPYHYSLLLHI